jgi:hypothetical protein
MRGFLDQQSMPSYAWVYQQFVMYAAAVRRRQRHSTGRNKAPPLVFALPLGSRMTSLPLQA